MVSGDARSLFLFFRRRPGTHACRGYRPSLVRRMDECDLRGSPTATAQPFIRRRFAFLNGTWRSSATIAADNGEARRFAAPPKMGRKHEKQHRPHPDEPRRQPAAPGRADRGNAWAANRREWLYRQAPQRRRRCRAASKGARHRGSRRRRVRQADGPARQLRLVVALFMAAPLRHRAGRARRFTRWRRAARARAKSC